MHTVRAEEFSHLPGKLLEDARRGEPTLITLDGVPLLATLPLGGERGTQAVLTDLAAGLFDSERISLGLAARLAGVSYAEMVDELSRRGIDTLRIDADELNAEVARFGG